ncbi:MAG: hypothetical protein LBE62_04685 [Azonexus sp.]|jgi:hypothetical protein|nr:hypothetical protein [Azonexus sp.]
MVKKLILWVLSYAWIALLLGLGFLGMAIYSIYSASHGGSIPPESALSSMSGHITEGREMVVETQRRRGGKTTRKYYELDLNPASGAIIKLRVDHDVSRTVLEAAIDEDVTVKYDPNDDNSTYVIQQGGKDLMSYTDAAALSQRHADADKAFFASGGMMGVAALLALLGGGGVWWRRKLLADSNASGQQG